MGLSHAIHIRRSGRNRGPLEGSSPRWISASLWRGYRYFLNRGLEPIRMSDKYLWNCRRCGCEYEPGDGAGVEIQLKPGGWHSFDVCLSCYKELEKWAGSRLLASLRGEDKAI